MSASSHAVTLIAGDGVGAECVTATQRVLAAAGARINWEPAEAGGVCFRKGISSGVPRETIDCIMRTRVALKGPLETPVGYGEKSANVTLRGLFELYANIRPTRELPGVASPFAGRGIDFVVVRENVEDLYSGIEHMQTPGVAQCLKLITRKGSEKICRLAFALARAEGRRKVHCATKANIMKLTEGLFKRTCEEVAREFAPIAHEHIIIDNCAHQLVRAPEQFDVIVTTNLNGDIISDLAAGLVGGLGLAPSANLGTEVAMFEAVHGSAPNIAGRNAVNPTALLLSAVMLLRHLGDFDIATRVEQAIVVTLEAGATLTGDLAPAGRAATTEQYTDAVIANLGKASPAWRSRPHAAVELPRLSAAPEFVAARSVETVGVDVFLQSPLLPAQLGPRLDQLLEAGALKLKMLSNRGAQVYPGGCPLTDCVDHYRGRFVRRDGGTLADGAISALLVQLADVARWVHVEKLQRFDGVAGYTLAQGEE